MFIQLTIGRNVGTTPMSQERWDEFQVTAADYLLDTMQDLTGLSVRQLSHTDAAFEKHYGTGHWDGRGEESCKIAVYFPVSMVTTKPPQTAQVMVDLNRALRELALEFNQDAIHIVTGGHLLKAKDARSLKAKDARVTTESPLAVLHRARMSQR